MRSDEFSDITYMLRKIRKEKFEITIIFLVKTLLLYVRILFFIFQLMR